MQGMEYRTNFIVWTLVDVGWTAIDLVFFQALISNIKMIGNWNLAQALIVIGTFRLLVFPVWGWMFASFNTLPKQISEGKLEMMIIKPVDSQFMVSVRQFSFSVLPSLIGGTIFLLLGVRELGYVPSFLNFIFFLGLLIVSVALMYGIYFISIALALFTERLNNIAHVFVALYDASRFPKEIYGIILQRILTTILPVALFIVVPSEVLFRPANWMSWLWFLILAVAFNVLARKIWLSGLRRYSSASS
jgi:ABC-2 type transport system permease protein